MDDDEDDMYAPAGTESKSSKPHQNTSEKAELARGEDQEEEAAEGAENDEDDESDSVSPLYRGDSADVQDIDIITESKGAPKLETPVYESLMPLLKLMNPQSSSRDQRNQKPSSTAGNASFWCWYQAPAE